MPTGEARVRCPYYAAFGEAAVKAKGGTVDHEYLKPEEQRLGAYSEAGYDGAVYYKGKRLGAGPLTDIGGGWASGHQGVLWFHGQEVEDVSGGLVSLVVGHRFLNAGNGYGLAQGRVFYCGKDLDIDGGDVHATELDHLGDGWSRTAANTYLFRGEVVPTAEARVRCPYYAALGEAAGHRDAGWVDSALGFFSASLSPK